MTADDPALATPADLNAALLSLLRRANSNGIDVEGGWECRHDGDCPDWDVVVTALRTDAGAD